MDKAQGKGDKTQTMQTSLCDSLFPARRRCSRGANLQGSRVRGRLVATLTDEGKSPSHEDREVQRDAVSLIAERCLQKLGNRRTP